MEWEQFQLRNNDKTPGSSNCAAWYRYRNKVVLYNEKFLLLGAGALLCPSIKAPSVVSERPETAHTGLRPMALLLLMLLWLRSKLLLRVLALIASV